MYKFLLSQVQCNLAYTLTTFGGGDKVASRRASGRSNFVVQESYLPHDAQTRVKGLSAGMRIHATDFVFLEAEPSGYTFEQMNESTHFLDHELSAHLREYHGIRGGDKLRVRCSWEDCTQELNKENLLRHMKGTHLKVAYSCDTCNKTFTREYNRNSHQAICAVQQQ
ncbi:hypothetical protein EV424DRAFT_1375355 [Suillus variegatus]|nr:hypothetical protein EV424DRAFT_1375355 [Suillus variegatus]